MQAKSFLKITAAGFTFYRERWSPETHTGEIVKATEPGRWTLHSKRGEYKSKAAMARAYKDLIDNDPMALSEYR